MMRVAGWLDGEWEADSRTKAAKQLRGFIFPDNLVLGFEIFQSGSVMKGEWESANRFEAAVADGKIYRTVIDFGFLPFSRCTCSSSGSCRHMAAAIYSAMRSKGMNVKSFLVEQGLRELQRKSGNHASGTSVRLPVRNASTPQKKGGSSGPVSPPGEGDDCREWHRKWSGLFPHYYQPPGRYLEWVENKLIRFADGWGDERIRRHYRAHAALYAMKLADRSFANDYGATKLHGNLVVRLTDDFQEAVLNWESAEGMEERARREGLRGLADIASEYAFDQVNTMIDWMHVYRYIGWKMNVDREWIAEERQRINERLNTGKLHGEQLQKRIAALAHLVLMEEGDEAAVRYLDRVWSGTPYVFFDYLQAYSGQSMWDRLEIWLNWLKPRMRTANPVGLPHYLDVWKTFLEKKAGREEAEWEWLKVLAELLPVSFEYYTDALLEAGEYRRWVDVHLWMEVEPAESKGFRMVESKAPEALLPYFHQMASRWIEQRNRDGYGRAVICMKVLRRLYTAMRRKDVWEMYVSRILKRHSRMRALHEEMRRGNIMV